MMNVQNFNRVPIDQIHDQVKERGENQFSCASLMAEPTPIVCLLQRTDASVDRSYRRFRLLRIFEFEIVLNFF